MILPDVNILVYAYREDSPNHIDYRNWIESVITSDQAFGVTNIVLSGFLRIVTHPRIFKTPSSIEQGFDFIHTIKNQPNCVEISPGSRFRDIFENLCLDANVKGNLVPDAYLAAIAIESGCEWITTDQDFSRFPGLNWRLPFTKQPW